MATADAPRSTVPRSRSRRRIVLWIVLAFALLGALVLVGSAPPILGARADLQRGETAVRQAQRHIDAGDVDAAVASFADAEAAFDSARRRMERLPVRLAGWIPALGNNVDAVTGLARAGTVAADGGGALAEGIAALPGGLGALAPTDGAFPTDAFAELVGPVSTASGRADEAMAILEATPESFLFGPIGQARWRALDELGDAARGLRASEGLVAVMPAFLGGDGTRRYLVASENPAELRGTGGFWGAYAVLTLRDGKPRFSDVMAIQDLPTVSAEAVPPPSPDYRQNYGEFGGAGSWHNLNMTPDLPTAARASLGAWELATGVSYDGLIVADPFALEALMRLTGPVTVRGTDVAISASEVVEFTTNGAYSVFEDTRRRKEVLGDVAIDVLRSFLDEAGRGIERVRALAEVVADGHLRLYAVDPRFEDALAVAGLDGAMPNGAASDVLLVDVNNAGANKIDFYAEREVAYDVRLGGEGESIGRTTVTIANTSPTRGEPRYVIGPAPPLVDEQDAGDQVSITRLWCHDPCTFVDGGVDGEPATLGVGTEAGLRWFRDVGTIPSGRERTIALVTRTRGTWEGNGSGGVYRLTVMDQTTIRPTRWSLRIQAPEGTRIVWTNEEMTVDGGVATWDGTIDRQLELEVRFSAPAPLRWWRNVLRPFGGL